MTKKGQPKLPVEENTFCVDSLWTALRLQDQLLAQNIGDFRVIRNCNHSFIMRCARVDRKASTAEQVKTCSFVVRARLPSKINGLNFRMLSHPFM